MLYRIAEVGASFDLLSVLLWLLQNALTGPSHMFQVPDDCGWSGYGIERMLKQHGVKLWGRMLVNHTIMFTVRMAQAEWAEYLLQREGIPLSSPRVRARVPSPSSKRRQSGSHSALDWLESLIEKLAQALAG